MSVNMMDEFGFGGSTELDTGTYPTILKLNTITGVWSLRNTNDQGEAVWENATFPKAIAVDMPNFKKGWNLLRKGQAPDSKLVKYMEVMPEKPSEDHKPCFEVHMYSRDLDYVVFSSNSICVIRKMQELLGQYQSRTESAPHLVPVCTMQMETVSTGNGDFHVPNFTIQKYVARPVQLISAAESTEPAAKPTTKPKVEVTEPEFDDSLDVLDADDEF